MMVQKLYIYAVFVLLCAIFENFPTSTAQASACSNGLSLTAETGTVNLAEETANETSNSFSCQWIITAPIDKVVRISFLKFDLSTDDCDCTRDAMVYDNDNSIYNFDSLRGSTIPKSFSSKSNIVKLSYNYYDSGGNTVPVVGILEMQWEMIEATDNSNTVYDCGETLTTAKDGKITSPGFPNTYETNVDCLWTIPAKPDQKIMIFISQAELEPGFYCVWDFLSIKSNETYKEFCDEAYERFVSVMGPIQIGFHSDQSITNKGFVLYYYFLDPSLEACDLNGGVTFNTPNGSFSDFGSPIFIPSDSCSWTITIDPSMDIHITFKEFNVPCGESIMEIVKPSDSYRDSICGSEIPETLTITSGPVTFFHRRKFFDTPSTFTISWTSTESSSNTLEPPFVTCSNYMEGSKGFIASDGYPGNYDNNIDKCWIFTNTGNMYELKMLGGQTEIEGSFDCQHDYLLISTDSGVDKYCDYSIPTLQSKQLTVAFHSDSSIVAGGFALAYGVKDADGIGLANETDTSCGPNVLTTPNGFISSPGFPVTSLSNSSCEWIISAPTGKAINFTFLYFQLTFTSQCTDSYIDVKDGKRASPKRLCSKPDQGLSTLTNELYLTFHSGSSSSSSTSGFALTYYFIDPPSDTASCGGTLRSWSLLLSPKRPDYYPPNKDCLWTIKVQPDETITLTSDGLNIEESENCSADFLEIQGKNEQDGQRFCGYQQGKLAEYTGTDVTVHFQSDSMVSGTGFLIYIESNLPVTCNSTGTSSSEAGYIFSPNYPSFYPRNVHCQWTISANNKMRFTIEDIDIERTINCNYDALVIYDGNRSDDNEQRYCGSSSPPMFVSSGNTVTVEFITDERRTGKGFRLTWNEYSTTVSPSTLETASTAQDFFTTAEPPLANTTSAARGLTFDHVIFLITSFLALMVQPK